MGLRNYRQKRNFKQSPEPIGRVPNPSKLVRSFVIQEHAASHLHYDFRLEMNGTLKSWAVPKGPCLDPNVKRLAVQVEDHPIEYGSFEGTIPKGNYGAGKVIIWDNGQWLPLQPNVNKAYQSGDLTFILKGKKLKGKWKLIKIKKDPKNWLLMKMSDEYAQPENHNEITKKKPLSVVSKKSILSIETVKNSHINKRLLEKIGKPQKTTPLEISPQLAMLVKQPPNSNDWLHEVKFDGYRLICVIKNKKITLMTRNKLDWTDKFPFLVKEIKKLKINNAILDGEVIAVGAKNKPDFQKLQNSLKDNQTKDIVYYVFDILYYDGFNLTASKLLDRKNLLEKIIAKKSTLIQYSQHVVGNGEKVFKEACNEHLEGIVSKHVDSPYLQKRTKNWVKSKCIKRQEFVIGGFTQPQGHRHYLGALLLGYYHDKKLLYCGRCGTGFTNKTLKDLSEKLNKYKTTKNPFKNFKLSSRSIVWVEPKLLAEVEFTNWTDENILRHSSFKGIRMDKKPITVGKEEIVELSSAAKDSQQDLKSLTHPEKILYPQDKITKLKIAEYYQKISSWILPYIKNRPLTLLRCPGGISSECFFQKHLDHKVKNIYKISIKEKKTNDYLYIKDIQGLLALVQLGVLEFHAWNCLIDKTSKPDMIIFDLDPGSGTSWTSVVKAAFLIRDRLEEINLRSYARLTGGKGLHIVIPIVRQYEWEKVKEFALAFVEALTVIYPKLFVSKANKNERKNKIFIDYLRNQKGATAVVSYSTRARIHAPVAVPISWDELNPRLKPNKFTIKNLFQRLDNLENDPWEDFFKIKQRLKLK